MRKLTGQDDGEVRKQDEKGEAGADKDTTIGEAGTIETRMDGAAKPEATDAPKESMAKGATNPARSSEKVNGTSSKTETQPSPTYEDTPWQMGPCDGICNRDLRDYDKGIYICIYCGTTWFCSECYAKHRESSLPYLLCDSDHEFAYVTGMPKEIGKNDIWVAGKARNRIEWLDEIRVKWGLPKKTKDGEVVKVEVAKGLNAPEPSS